MKNNDKLLAELENIAVWMDAKFIVPGTNIRFGLDSLIGLVPGIGDTLGMLVSAYIFHRAVQHNVPHHHRAVQHNVPHHIKISMLLNIFIDWLVGTVPLVGDLFDVKWKANIRNVDLLRRHLRGQ